MKYSKNERVQSIELMFCGLAITIAVLLISCNRNTVAATDYIRKASTGHKISMTSNDFSVAHQTAKFEATHPLPINTHQFEKLIRSSIFDFGIIGFLTHILTLFTLSAYLARLSPKWNPSIYIAHCRFVI